MSRLVWLMMLGLVMALALSCVKSEEEPLPPPGGEGAAALRHIVLQLEDLPEGFSRSAEGGTSRNVSGYDMATQAYRLASATETAPGSVTGIQSWVLRFASPDEAEESFALMKEQSPTLANDADNPLISDLWQEVEPLPPPLSDDSFAYQGVVKPPPDKPNYPEIIVTLVAVRRGQLVGALTVAAVTSPPPESVVMDLVQKMDTRLRQALAQE